MTRRRIMVVEDENIVAEHIRYTLTKLGYDAPEAIASGEEAVEKAGELRPDLVLMDIKLKGKMDGVETAERIRSRFDVPVIYLTAHADEATLQRAKVSGSFGYILKPVQADNLHSTIEIALYKHQADRKLQESEERFRRIIENAPFGYYRVGRDELWQYVNPEWERMHGYSLQEIAGKHFEATQPEETQANIRRALAGEVLAGELERRRKDGSIGYHAFSIQPVYRNEEVVAVEGFINDITERVRAEEALRRYADEQAALYAIASASSASLDPVELLSTLLDVVLAVTRADAGWVILPGPTPDDLPRVAVWRGVSESFVAAEEATPLHTCPVCAALLADAGALHGPIPLATCPRLPAEVLADLDLHDHAGIPLSAGDQVLGILNVAWRTAHPYSEEDRALLTAIGRQVGLALRNARLYQDARRVDRLEVLNAITAAAVSSLELDTLLRQILHLTCCALGAIEGAILLRAPGTDELVFSQTLTDGTAALQGQHLTPGQGIAGWVAQSGRAVHVNNVHLDPRWYGGVDESTGFQTRSLACVPLRHRGEITGVIEVVNKRQGAFTDDDLSMLEAVASVTTNAMENARLYTTMQVRAQELATLNEIGLALSATLDPSAVVHVALSLVQRFFKAEGTALLQVDPQTQELHSVRALVGETPVEAPVRLRLGEGVVGQTLRQRRPALIEDTQSDPRWSRHADRYVTQYLGQPARGVMVAPLLTPGDATGVVIVASTEPGTYTHQQLKTLQAIASTLAVALENARLYEAERATRRQLRDLTGYLQTAREEERTRIAREIHDELGQILTALKMDLSWLARRLPVDEPDLAEKAGVMSGLIDETIQAVRHIATELRPGLLDDLGLVAALEWQAQEFAKRTGIECELHLGEDLALDRDLATAVFRIFQETLTNVARHAEATRVRVTLEDALDGLTLTVRDDGRGIAESQVSDSKSLGLIGMRERARAMGGDVTFQGSPGKGTTVTVRISGIGREEKVSEEE